MKTRIFFICIVLALSDAMAQLPGNISQPVENIIADSQKISFNFKALSFFKNNEYFNPIDEGYTLIGYNLEPSILFQPVKKVSVEAGGNFLKYSGRNGFTDIQPIFRFRFQPSESFQMVMGNLYGGSNHHLYEPLYRWERDFTNPVESGIQFLLNSEKYKADVWLNWEKFVFHGDPFQEQLMVGITSEFRLNNPQSDLNISAPLQVLFKHQGGQIISIDTSLVTIANWATGLKFSSNNISGLFKKIEFEIICLGYSDLSPQKLQQYKNGIGLLSNVGVIINNFHLKLGYYHVSSFIAPMGERLYHSASFPKTDISYGNFDLILGKFSYQKLIAKGLALGAYFESFSKLSSGKTDYSYGVHLLADFNILLFRYK